MSRVVHQPQLHCFTIDLDGQLAKLDYRLLNDDVIEFTSTHVPFSLRGHGYGAELVAAGLEWAKKHNYQVTSRCWYVDRFLDTAVS
ncbi:MAG: N-acetyltransferase [Gammaproteobacteria bacterium]|uniref:GNAT family N-acetyltransferase n=1 Tax=Pseudomaricurvus alcaniphilus TaxID=1166482 RepID=UPI0014094E7B|nr:GNAT family N-acetyltransferase [Pseudomaricurvus alcaniphilus]MBR9911210.1 N-acetyltransferase [Gammaproteobacteria bacterium]NHN37589.1 N-acetyltransferase [Pseudomaricurvus alcaniphilus]